MLQIYLIIIVATIKNKLKKGELTPFFIVNESLLIKVLASEDAIK